MKHEFEDIEIKRNAPMILEQQLKSRRRPAVISTGAMTDPYMPIEERVEYTRECLKVIKKYGFGVAVLTKSARVLRDLDLLKAINEETKAVVEMTLTTFDDDLCKKIEPYVSTTSQRVEALKTLKKEGIPTVVWLGPFLPFINDTEENLDGLLEYIKDAGVKGIVCFGFGVTMREGNREYFYQKLDEKFPGVKEKYQRKYGLAYSCSSPNHQVLMEKLRAFCKENDILLNRQTFEYLDEFESKNEQLSLF
jgi:DNA repair photolyase